MQANWSPDGASILYSDFPLFIELVGKCSLTHAQPGHAKGRSAARVGRLLVEAAGVEPASEIAVSQESPCSVRFD